MTWNGTYFTNNFPLYYTISNQGTFGVFETTTDSAHSQGSKWVGEIRVTEKKPDAYVTATNDPDPSYVRVYKSASNTGKGLPGAYYGVYKDQACKQMVAEAGSNR